MRPITEERAERLGSVFVSVLSAILVSGLVLEATGVAPGARATGAVLAGALVFVAGVVALLLAVLG